MKSMTFKIAAFLLIAASLSACGHMHGGHGGYFAEATTAPAHG